MKKKLFLAILTLGALVAGYIIFLKISSEKADKEHQKWVNSLEHTASPYVEILHDTITVDYLNEKRTLAIYLPQSYLTDTVDYSIIYFLDGQSLFDQKILEGTEWQVDEVLDSLALIKGEQAIIVGIYNSDERMKEYKPFPSDSWYSDKIVNGDKHASWIVKSLKPWIDAKYRTKKESESTVIAGASLGGLMSYFMLMEYPKTFGSAIVFSPSFWVNEKVYSLHKKNKELPNQKIYFNAGQLEVPTVESVEKMYKILINDGMLKKNIQVDIEKDEGHWHMTWRKGFKKAFPWILNTH